jgi:hypothetical protein
MLDAELLQRPAHLGRMLLVHLAAGLRRQEVMTAAIGVDARRQPACREHLQEASHRGSRALLLDQKHRVDRARRIVHRHDQVQRRLAAKPFVLAAVPRLRGAGSGAASCPHRASAPACADGLRAAEPTQPDPNDEAASWSRCSSTRTRATSPDARGNASRSSPGNACGIAPVSIPDGPPGPASQTPCQVVCRQVPPDLPPRSDPASAGTDAPNSPESRLLPAPTTSAPRSGPKHPETSSSCGPAATLSDPSPSPLEQLQNRTSRVLRNPDISCANDSCVRKLDRRKAPNIIQTTIMGGGWRCNAASRFTNTKKGTVLSSTTALKLSRAVPLLLGDLSGLAVADPP